MFLIPIYFAIKWVKLNYLCPEYSETENPFRYPKDASQEISLKTGPDNAKLVYLKELIILGKIFFYP